MIWYSDCMVSSYFDPLTICTSSGHEDMLTRKDLARPKYCNQTIVKGNKTHKCVADVLTIASELFFLLCEEQSQNINILMVINRLSNWHLLTCVWNNALLLLVKGIVWRKILIHCLHSYYFSLSITRLKLSLFDVFFL